MTPQQIRDAIAASAELQALGSEHGAIAAALSTGYEATQTRDVEAWFMYRYLVKRGRWASIQAAAEDTQHPARLAALAAVQLAQGPAGMRIDLADPSAETQGMLSGLVATSLITQAMKDEMVGWCKVPRVVSVNEVIEAMKGA